MPSFLRRELVKAGLAGIGLSALVRRTAAADEPPDYIVVGSGAGGGTVAARLAETRLSRAGPRSRRRSAYGQRRQSRSSRRRHDAGRLRRAGVPRPVDRERRHPLGLRRPALRRQRPAAPRPQVHRQASGRPARRRRALSARGRARRLHRAQRDDPRLSVQLGLGSARRSDRRRVVAARGDARLLRAARELPPPQARTLQGEVRLEPEPSRLVRLAHDREGRAGVGVPRSRPAPDDPGLGKGGLGGAGGADRSRAVGEPGRSERLARGVRGRRRHPLYAAHDRRAPARRRPRAAARRGEEVAGSAGHQDQRAGDPRAVRRDTRDRRRVSRRRAAVSRPSASIRRRPGGGSAGDARSDPCRRHVQHAAAADAVRASDRASTSRISAFQWSSTRRVSARTCRIATRSRSSTRCRRPGGRSRARRSPTPIRSTASGRIGGMASTRPTARSSRSACARALPHRFPTCSATACSPISAATSRTT